MARVDARVVALTGSRKAAILLITLGEAIAGQVMKHLDDDEVQRITKEVALAQKVTAEQAEDVLTEYYEMSLAHDYVLRGGVDFARNLLSEAYGGDKGKRVLDRILKHLGGESLSFETLQKADPQQLAKFIHSEHPQTIALILSHLNPPQAAGLLRSEEHTSELQSL